MRARLDTTQVKTFDIKLSVFTASKQLDPSNNIQNRLKALLHLKEVAELADKNSGSRISKLTSYIMNDPVTVTSPMAISWFTEVSLLDHLNDFENKEMAQASEALLTFFKKHVPETDIPGALKLSSERMGMMHESARENMFGSLATLVKVMTPKEVDRVVAVLRDIPPADHSNSSIAFVSTLTQHCSGRQNILGTLGNVLWDIFHSAEALEYTQTIAFEQFLKLIKRPHFGGNRGVYFAQCINDMDNNVAAYRAVVVAKSILDLDPGLLNTERDNKTLVKVLNIFTSSFVTYYVCTEQKLLGMREEDGDNVATACAPVTDEDVESARFEDGITHKQQLAVRLEFLSFIATKFMNKVPLKYVTQIWSTIHDYHVCDRDKDTLYAWILENVMPLSAIVRMAESRDARRMELCTFFNACVLKCISDFDGYISANLFDVIIRFFVASNLYNNGIDYEAPPKDADVDVLESVYATTVALVGLDKIIFAITRAINDDFFDDTINFFNSLFRKVVNIYY